MVKIGRFKKKCGRILPCKQDGINEEGGFKKKNLSEQAENLLAGWKKKSEKIK